MKARCSILVLFFASICLGQSIPDAPKPHRFFDKTNDALFAGVVTVTTLDGWSTQQYVKYEGVPEPDIIARPFVMHHWQGQVVLNTMGVGATIYGSYWLHKHKHHRLERILPITVFVVDSYCVAGNIRWINEYSGHSWVKRPGW